MAWGRYRGGARPGSSPQKTATFWLYVSVGWLVGWLVVKEQCSGWASANLHLTVFRLGACRLHVLTRKTGLCHCVRFTAPRWGWETRAHRI